MMKDSLCPMNAQHAPSGDARHSVAVPVHVASRNDQRTSGMAIAAAIAAIATVTTESSGVANELRMRAPSAELFAGRRVVLTVIARRA